MSEYGYIPESPAQSFRNNKGIFTPSDIYDLTLNDKFTNLGQLEFISTTDISSGTTNVDITELQEEKYKVHLFTLNDVTGASGGGLEYQYSELLNGVSTLETASVYQWAHQNQNANATNSESRNTVGYNAFGNGGLPNNGYIYLYNAGDTTKYTFTSWHSSNQASATLYNTCFGSNVMTQTSRVCAIRFRISSSSINFSSGSISLYGIKAY